MHEPNTDIHGNHFKMETYSEAFSLGDGAVDCLNTIANCGIVPVAFGSLLNLVKLHERIQRKPVKF